jgi:hypothetical protein
MLGDHQNLRAALFDLAQALKAGREQWMATSAEEALYGSQEQFEKFLVSNELWGGSGSIADQAEGGSDRTRRRGVEALLIRLGRMQMAAGVVNVRTQTWVEVFEKWQRSGI